jgi:hypothetical protein
MKTKFIELPNGDLVHSESIRAIRLGNAEGHHKPRVVLDFIIGDHCNYIVLNCDTVEERNKLAIDLKAKLYENQE